MHRGNVEADRVPVHTCHDDLVPIAEARQLGICIFRLKVIAVPIDREHRPRLDEQGHAGPAVARAANQALLRVLPNLPPPVVRTPEAIGPAQSAHFSRGKPARSRTALQTQSGFAGPLRPRPIPQHLDTTGVKYPARMRLLACDPICSTDAVRSELAATAFLEPVPEIWHITPHKNCLDRRKSPVVRSETANPSHGSSFDIMIAGPQMTFPASKHHGYQQFPMR